MKSAVSEKKSDGNSKSGIKFIFRALSYRNYRLYFGGQGISLIGTWMQRIAISWLVYTLTNSVFLLGFVGFATQMPTFLLGPLAGVAADRWNRYHILIVTQIMAMIQAFILAVLVLTDVVAVWHIITLGAILGIVNAFDTPARQALVVDMIEDRADLGNAIALNSSMVNGARLLGPSIAGILIAAFGEGICFLLNGLSYIAVIVALLAMRITVHGPSQSQKDLLGHFKDGIKYAFGFPPIRSILMLLALVSLMGMPYTVLMPIFAKDILHGGPHTLGFLMGSVGAGALTGAAYLASRRSVVGLGKIIPLAAGVFGTGLILFSLSRMMWFSMALLYFTGMGMMVQMAASNTVLQTIIDDDKRGRVMSFYAMSFFGMVPLGNLMAGSLASSIGTTWTIISGGVVCIIGALIFSRKLPVFRQLIHPIYVRKGIIPELADALQMSDRMEGRH